MTTRTALATCGALCIALHPGLARAQAPSTPATPATAPPPAEQPVFGRYSEIIALRLGGSLGPDFFSGTSGLRLQADLQYTLFEISPRTYLDLAGHLAGVFASGATILEEVPKARLRYLLLDPLTLYGDLGLGLAVSSLSAPGGSETHLLGDLRFAGGLQYRVTPELTIVVEPMGLNVYFGTGSAFHYSILIGALYRVL